MFCNEVIYRNFRNMEEAKLAFDDGINVIVGDNAMGKTSAVEGIYFCAQGRSHRTFRERDFVRFGAGFATIGLTYTDRHRRQKMEAAFALPVGSVTDGARGRIVKKCTHNGLAVKKMSEFIGHFRAVLFTPEHLSLVKEGPALRRSFLDAAISQLDRTYMGALQRYNGILQNRNRILSDAWKQPALLDTLEGWSRALAAEAAVVAAGREAYTKRLNEMVRAIFADMTQGREIPTLTYPAAGDEEFYFRQLTQAVETEVRQGTTKFGPHRDDLNIQLNGKEARSFASQGQQRSLALAMKLSEGEISRQDSGEYPVFLFDDVLSELDAKRQSYLMAGLAGRQVILTTCETGRLFQGSRVIRCENGNFFTSGNFFAQGTFS